MNKLTKLEELQQETADEKIRFTYHALPARIKGLYYSAADVPPVIALTPHIPTSKEEICVLAEELGHYHTSSGNLLAQGSDKLYVTKQEERASRWAYKKLVPLNSFVLAFEYGVQNKYELADYLDVTEDFLDYSLCYYKKIYGLAVSVDERYAIYFEPFGIFKDLE